MGTLRKRVYFVFPVQQYVPVRWDGKNAMQHCDFYLYFFPDELHIYFVSFHII